MLVQWISGHIYANQQSPSGELAESCHFCENGTLPAGSPLNQISPQAYRIHCMCALRRFRSRFPIHCSDIVYSTHGHFIDDNLHDWSKPNKGVRVRYKWYPGWCRCYMAVEKATQQWQRNGPEKQMSPSFCVDWCSISRLEVNKV